MPSTDLDEALIASMPPGTRVRDGSGRRGTVTDVEYGQIGVQFDRTQARQYLYPTHLYKLAPVAPADVVEGDRVTDDEADTRRTLESLHDAVERAISLGFAGESITGIGHLVTWYREHNYTLPEPAEDV